MPGYIPLPPSPDASAPAVLCRGLSFTYPGVELPALGNISFDVPTGATVALLGHNGAGKSTLLKILAGQHRAETGKVTLFGQAPGTQPQRVAYLEQRASLNWSFPITLRELVATGTFVRLGWLRCVSRSSWRRVDAALDELGLGDFGGRPVRALSGGQQQRALLARALVHEADLLLLDEPFTAVDIGTQEVLLNILRKMQEQKKTLVISTHDLEAFEPLKPICLHLHQGELSAS